MKLKHVLKWLCNYGTGHTHCSRYIHRKLQKTFIAPFLIIYVKHVKVPFCVEAHIYTLRVAITLCWRRLYISHMHHFVKSGVFVPDN